jgi:hypothetical protein
MLYIDKNLLKEKKEKNNISHGHLYAHQSQQTAIIFDL